MQKVKLPITVDPFKAAQKRLDYIGIYPANLLVRLKDSVLNVESDIDASFSFDFDQQQLVTIKGNARVDVTLCCQRCGQDMYETFNINYCYSPVHNDEQAELLSGTYEAVELDEFNEIDLLSIIEDEFILALPIVPVHDIEHCKITEEEMVFGELPAEAEKENPFAVLASLKQK